MVLIQDHHLLGFIAVAENACERETYAAEELRYYFIRMTGQKVEAKRISERDDDAIFVIGSACKYYGEELETLEDDELHWYEKNNKVFFNGGNRGLLYSIYDFLEFLGCRFFTATCEKIPTYGDLALDDNKDRRDKPAFTYRELYHRDFWQCENDSIILKSRGSFAAKMRQNGHHTFLPEGAGKPVKYAIFIHSFYHLLPIKEYYKDHPEWFDFNNGVRRDGETAKMNWDLCLTNPEVIDMLIKNTRKALLEHPEAEIISISQNDCDCACHCDKCNAVDEEEGFRSGLLLRVVNTIAEALEEEFPKVKFEMLPYTYARQLPKVTRPRHNVILRACTIECCFFHPIADRCANEARLPRYFADDLKDWGTTGAPIYIWDYVTSFHHYNLPHPNWRVLQPNMQFFHENNARGMFAQGNETGSHGTDLEELRAYLLCKLMWDPYLDQAALIKEFTDYFYGPAGKYVREYIETLCNNCEECNVCIGCYQYPYSDYLFPQYMKMYNEIFDRAEAAVAGNAKYLSRIHKARLSLRYTELITKAVADHEHNAEELNEFFADCFEYGVLLHEGGPSLRRTTRAFAEEVWGSKRSRLKPL